MKYAQIIKGNAMNNAFNETEIRKAISLLIGEGNIFECRILNSANKSQQYSAYFKSSNSLIANLSKQDLRDSNVYIILNKIKNECYGRKQAESFKKVNTSTSDTDVERRWWLLIDIDPERPSDTSSTDAQLAYAKKKMSQVYKFLQNAGFTEPIMACSGNGYHLLYRIDLENSEQNKNLIKRFLETLDVYFSDEFIKIDKSVFNASRICKLYGTYARKGRDIPEQPHRMSEIKYVPEMIEAVKKIYIQKVVDSIKEEQPKPSRYNNYNAGSFDIEEWMRKYGINYKPTSYSDGTKYILDCCPFDSNHKGKDAVIFKMQNGAIGFKCFHNSCSDKTWKDVRLLYEPDAYSKKWEDQKNSMYESKNRYVKIQPRQIEVVQNEPVFMTAKQIMERPSPPESFIKTGITEIDKTMRGLKKEHTSIWSGLRGSAKSTVLSQIALNAVNDNNTVICYSGELSSKSFMRWMNQQAAGHKNEPSAFEGYYNTPIVIREKIAEWLSDRFFLYNNYYGNNFEEIIKKVEEKVEKEKADFVILDNLMSFNISSMGNTKWDAQSAFVWKLHELAMQQHIHIAFVAHPKKAAGFLRFDDISGTADLGNAVDDAFIVHRNNQDFQRLTADMFKWHPDNEVYRGTNVIEIVKDRDGGTQDCFIPLYYEARSKRLKNSPEENVVYGWEQRDENGFMEVAEGFEFDEI